MSGNKYCDTFNDETFENFKNSINKLKECLNVTKKQYKEETESHLDDYSNDFSNNYSEYSDSDSECDMEFDPVYEIYKYVMYDMRKLNSSIKNIDNLKTEIRNIQESSDEITDFVDLFVDNSYPNTRRQLFANINYEKKLNLDDVQKVYELALKSYKMRASLLEDSLVQFFFEISKINESDPDAKLPTEGDVFEVFELYLNYREYSKAKKEHDDAEAKFEKQKKMYTDSLQILNTSEIELVD